MNKIILLLLIVIIIIFLCTSRSKFTDKDNKSEEYFNENIEVFVINLPRSIERKDAITKQLNEQNIKYHLIEAVDGEKMKLGQVKGWTCERTRAPARGRWSTELLIYEKIINNEKKYEWTLILEDDSIIPTNFKYKIYEAITKYPNGKVFRLQKLSEHGLNNKKPFWGLTAQLYKSDIIPFLYRFMDPYYVFPKEAEWINQRCLTDTRLYGIIYFNKIKTILYPIVGYNHDFKSTIAGSIYQKIAPDKDQISKESN